MVTSGTLPGFDLVVATVDRVEPLDRLFDSLDRQSHGHFRVLLVDQNQDARLEPVIGRHRSLEIVHLGSPRGLSRARNEALGLLDADVVAFPDDDCVYADDLLERIALRFARDPGLGGLVGRAVDTEGRSDPNWDEALGRLTRDNVWHRGISFTIFLRRGVVERVRDFDEKLGVGSPDAWASGEEIDYLIRAIGLGDRLEYDPAVTVVHPETQRSPEALRALRYRDGTSVGYILRKHRYPARAVARMLVRPLGGAALSLARADLARARTHLSTFRGRLAGLTGR